MGAEKLRELAERVEAGEAKIEICADVVGPDLFVTMASISEEFAPLTKSLDACLALHGAVLGGRWFVARLMQMLGCWEMQLEQETEGRAGGGDWVMGEAGTPARAYLSAILRALAAEAAQTPDALAEGEG